MALPKLFVLFTVLALAAPALAATECHPHRTELASGASHGSTEGDHGVDPYLRNLDGSCVCKAGFWSKNCSVAAGDTAWMLLCALLVFLMTPALAFFYGGASPNSINTLMMSIVAIPVITAQWFLFGYSITYAPDSGSRIYGDLRWGGFRDVAGEANGDYAENIPHALFATYQMMFAIITPALISGAVIGRMTWRAYVIYIIIWSTFCYDIIAHWVWSANTCKIEYTAAGPSIVCARKGWLRELGVIDFGGGIVVHLTAGWAALAAAIIVGKRKGHDRPLVPHNVSLVVLGAGLLWFGWFGFNGGNGYLADDVAGMSTINTQLSAAAGLGAWMLLEFAHERHVSASQASIGMVVGLIASTPNAGFVEPWAAFVIGGIGAVASFYAIKLKHKLNFDDTLDVFACHGVGGVVGPLCTGLFATKKVNPLGADGAFYGNGRLFGVQLLAVVVTIALSVVITTVTLLALKRTIGIRVDPSKEDRGMDSIAHGEIAYLIEGYDKDGHRVLSFVSPPKEGSTRLSVKEFVCDDSSLADGSIRPLHGPAEPSINNQGQAATRLAQARQLYNEQAAKEKAAQEAARNAEGGSIRGTFSQHEVQLEFLPTGAVARPAPHAAGVVYSPGAFEPGALALAGPAPALLGGHSHDA